MVYVSQRHGPSTFKLKQSQLSNAGPHSISKTLDVLLEEEARQLIKSVKMVSKCLRYVEARKRGLPTASES